MNYIKLFICIIFFISNSKLACQNTIIDSTRLINILDRYEDRINNLEKDYRDALKEQIQENNNGASRIIDWTSMFFGLIAVFTLLAGAIGIREFSKITQLREEVEKNLEETKNELDKIKEHKERLEEIESYRNSVLNNTKEFVEAIYYFNSGLQSYYEGDYVKSKQLLYKVIDRNPDNTHALYFIAKSYYRENNLEFAQDLYRKILSIEPNNSYAYMGLADISGSSEKEEEYLLKSIDLKPDNHYALDSLGSFYRNQDKLDKALEYYLAAYRLQPMRSVHASNIAIIYFAKGNNELSEKYFDECKYCARIEIEKARAAHWAYFRLALIESIHNNFIKAKTYIDYGIKFNSSPSVRYGFANYTLKFILNHIETDNTAVKKLIDYLKS